ncbi:MAG: regulatory protein RecX [Aeromonas sp.]
MPAAESHPPARRARAQPVDPATLSPAEQLTAAKNYAMRSLGRRESAASELASRLKQRGFSAPIIAEVVAFCVAQQWVDDGRFAAMFVRAGAQKGQGPSKIRFELRRKGLTDTQIVAAFEQPELDWFMQAHSLLARRAPLADLQDFKRRAKWQRYLFSRGFSQDQVRYAIDTCLHGDEA